MRFKKFRVIFEKKIQRKDFIIFFEIEFHDENFFDKEIKAVILEDFDNFFFFDFCTITNLSPQFHGLDFFFSMNH